jgi:hypothetical protein
MLQIGQKIYVKRFNARNREADDIREAIINKIGKKYFYLNEYPWVKFSISEMRDISNYASDYGIYLSEQEIKDEKEYFEKLKFLKDTFDYCRGKKNFTLDQLKKICNIINNE